jgi:arsenate reductase
MKNKATLFHGIKQEIQSLLDHTLATSRKTELEPLIDYIQDKKNRNQQIRLNFICTHNSRRSHLAQIWAQVAAAYYDIPSVTCYSGGTEATALFSSVVFALEKHGFKIESLSNANNPIYSIKYSEDEHPIIGFSKKYDHSFNPSGKFAAILTCSSADKGCPFIAGAEKRIPLPFEDPKNFDNTPLQTEKYNERSLEIAATLLYVFSQIK